jgi:hypothetical protein
MEAQQTPGGGVVLGFPDFAVVGHALQVAVDPADTGQASTI